ncbi:hypothetical protein Scep_030659 [Stephania cephalantha]|uniref:Uncharacterized protein n=1 Tax=Stephania cephalantha TaxID=152367 RepID=A0AAP0E7V4_9MAGN
MGRRSGNVISVQRSMQCSQIGRLTPRLVAPKSTNVTVEPSSPEETASSHTELSVMP